MSAALSLGLRSIKKFASVGSFMSSVAKQEATIKLHPFQLHILDKGPNDTTVLTRTDALKYYDQMLTIRRMELLANALYKMKLVRGFCHLCNGQEAVCVGFRNAMRPGDSSLTSYRAHGWVNIMGASPREVLGELLGKVTGVSRGKGGSMHMYTQDFYGGNGIVGSQVPLGTGLAFAYKYTGTKKVCIIGYGDGAANQGQVYESFNMAKLWNLPCVYLCENNLYGMGTSVVRCSVNTEFFKRCEYIPGVRMDGMDVLSCREGTRFAINHILEGKGPIIAEMVTYRYFGHSLSDPDITYRTRKEIDQVRELKDPIKTFGVKIVEAGLVTQDDLEQIKKRIKKEMTALKKVLIKDEDSILSELKEKILVKPLEPVRDKSVLKL